MKKKPHDSAKMDQRAKFVEAARELGCSENDEAFDSALKKVSSAPPTKAVKKRRTKKPAK